VGIPVTNPELVGERLSWHIKNLDTFQSHLDCRGYSCHQGHNMCMRSKLMFLSTIIPGPSSLGRNIDVCLQPLIDVLTQMWSSRALTYDISRKHNFVMRAALMWAINDFPAYGMVFG
jgi:hypothetical protein